MIRSLAGVLLSAAAVLFGGWPPAAAQPVHKDQDGIAAELSHDEASVSVRWRFLKPLEQPLDEVSATLNGRPLGTPSLKAYPAGGEATAVMALVDVTGLERQAQIDRFKAGMLRMAARKAAHDQVGFAVYGLEASLLIPGGEDPDEIVAMLAQIPALDEMANLSGALLSSMRTLATVAADRRAVFVFTDGHNDGSVALADLEQAVRESGVALTFLVVPSDRASELPALARLAAISGGQVIAASEIDAFLAEPFALLDSGAEARFPLDAARRYFWESQSAIDVLFRYGGRRLEIAAPASVPSATIPEFASYLVARHPAGMLGTGGMAIAAAAALAFAKRKRRGDLSGRQPVPRAGVIAPKPDEILAALVDVDNNAVFPLKSPLTRIGRSGDNDIVLDEKTVGRFHAIVQQVGDRMFSIQDQSSTNGTLLNNRKIDSASLSDGDLIMLGSRTLRFSQAAAVR